MSSWHRFAEHLACANVRRRSCASRNDTRSRAHQVHSRQPLALASENVSDQGGNEMIVMFSARRLKPGAWEQFRRAWDPGDARPPALQRVYHARNIRDEDEIISFGLFDMTEDEYRRWRAEADEQEMQRVDHLSALGKTEPVSGVYEVIEELEE